MCDHERKYVVYLELAKFALESSLQLERHESEMITFIPMPSMMGMGSCTPTQRGVHCGSPGGNMLIYSPGNEPIVAVGMQVLIMFFQYKCWRLSLKA